MLISIFTGLAAGALHVVGGADHLVSMAPCSFRNPGEAFKSGIAWGLGHSVGVLLLSLFAVIFKDLAKIERVSSLAEFAVGVALLVIGFMAIRTSLGLDIHTHKHNHSNGANHEHVHLHIRSHKRHSNHSHKATSLGLLHGLAGASHFLAVIPALALPPFAAFAYMAAYLFASVVVMGLFLAVLSLATLKVSKRAMPILFASTGGLSLVTGFFWLQKTFP